MRVGMAGNQCFVWLEIIAPFGLKSLLRLAGNDCFIWLEIVSFGWKSLLRLAGNHCFVL
jgi:hypothetical protein